MSNEPRSFCRTKKKEYRSKSDAEEDLKRMLDRPSHRLRPAIAKDPVRAYQCTYCRHWHLTSQPK